MVVSKMSGTEEGFLIQKYAIDFLMVCRTIKMRLG